MKYFSGKRDARYKIITPKLARVCEVMWEELNELECVCKKCMWCDKCKALAEVERILSPTEDKSSLSLGKDIE